MNGFNIVSDDDISEFSGDFPMEMIGGANIYSGEGMQDAEAAAAARAAGGVALITNPPALFRRQALPIPRTPVNALTQSGAINSNPQRFIRIDGLRIPDSIAPSFTVDLISINQEQQYVAPGTVPAELFGATSIGSYLRGATASRGSIVSIQVTNLAAAPAALTFAGGYFGPVVMSS